MNKKCRSVLFNSFWQIILDAFLVKEMSILNQIVSVKFFWSVCLNFSIS